MHYDQHILEVLSVYRQPVSRDTIQSIITQVYEVAPSGGMLSIYEELSERATISLSADGQISLNDDIRTRVYAYLVEHKPDTLIKLHTAAASSYTDIALNTAFGKQQHLRPIIIELRHHLEQRDRYRAGHPAQPGDAADPWDLPRDFPRTLENDEYILLDKIGAGGQALVYRVFSPKEQRQLAVKTFSPEYLHRMRQLENSVEYRRFRNEIEFMQRFEQHPHVLSVKRHNIHQDTPPLYMIMPLIRGSVYPRRGRLTLRDLGIITDRISNAIQAMHDAHCIHRDIKPDNILLGDHGEPFLSDFGLAVNLEHSRISIFHEDTFKGTKLYAAPEALTSNELDPRIDQYAFAVTLYELLTGRLPFPTMNAKLNGSFSLISEWLQKPQGRTIAELYAYPDHARRLDEIFLRALATDPAQRFESVREFAEAILTALPISNGHLATKLGIDAATHPQLPAQPPADISDKQQDDRTTFIPGEPRKAARLPGSRGTLIAVLLLFIVGAGIVITLGTGANNNGGDETATSTADLVATQAAQTQVAMAAAPTHTPTEPEPSATQTPSHTPSATATATTQPSATPLPRAVCGGIPDTSVVSGSSLVQWIQGSANEQGIGGLSIINNRVWFYVDGQLLSYDGNYLEACRENEQTETIEAIYAEPDRVWAAAAGKIWTMQQGSWQLVNELAESPIRSIAYLDRTLWAATERGLAYMVSDPAPAWDFYDQENISGSQDLFFDQNNQRLWFVSDNREVRFDDRFGEDESLSLPENADLTVNDLYVTATNQVWVQLSDGSFLRHVRDDRWQTISGPPSLSAAETGGFVLDVYGQMWLATRDGLLLNRPGSGRWVQYAPQIAEDFSGLGLGCVECEGIFSDNYLWFSTRSGKLGWIYLPRTVVIVQATNTATASPTPTPTEAQAEAQSDATSLRGPATEAIATERPLPTSTSAPTEFIQPPTNTPQPTNTDRPPNTRRPPTQTPAPTNTERPPNTRRPPTHTPDPEKDNPGAGNN